MSKYDKFSRHPVIKRLTGTLTRPTEGSPVTYAAGDLIANSLTAPTATKLQNAALANGRGGKIKSLILIDSANLTLAGNFEIWFFNAAYTPVNDNEAFAPSDAVAETVEAVISLAGSGAFIGNAGADAAGNRIYMAKDINKEFQCAGNSRDLWWALVARNAYVPVSAEKFTLKLDIEQR